LASGNICLKASMRCRYKVAEPLLQRHGAAKANI